MIATERIAPCLRCGNEQFHADKDLIGVTWTCVRCGACRYTDLLGAAAGPAEWKAEPGDGPAPAKRARRLTGLVCTVVRVYRQEVVKGIHGASTWRPTPNEGVCVVGVYHTPPAGTRPARRILWAETAPPLAEGTDEASLQRFRQAVRVVLGVTWGDPGVFPARGAFEVRPWGYSLRCLPEQKVQVRLL